MKKLLSITLILFSLATYAQEGGADQFKIKTDYLQLSSEKLAQLDTTTLKVLAVDENGNVGYTLSGAGGGDGFWLSNASDNYIYYNPSYGDVRMGSPTDTLRLFVSGKIYTTEVYVRTAIPAPDYVFEEGYQLTKLDELESFLKENKHLPEIPSGKEMETNGLSLSEMNLLLLKKVEELTLYLLQQDKRIRELEKEPPPAPPKGESKRATGSS
jgi:hypothetical protein